MSIKPVKAHNTERVFEQQLREMNEELLISSVRQHELTEKAQQAEALMRESEERYRVLFASAPMAVFVCDRNAVIQHYNRRAVELWGREPVCGVEQHCGSLKLWLPTGDFLPHAQSPMVEVLRTGIPAFNVEVLIERPDGVRLPVIVNFAALENSAGEIIGGITSFVDISDRKEAEASLLAAERRATEKYQALLSRIIPLAHTLGAARDLISVHRAVKDFIISSTSASAILISFYESEPSLRTAAYAWSELGEVDVSTLPPITLTEDGGPNSQAVFQRKSIVVNNLMEVMKSRPHVVIEDDGIDPNSSLAVPMIVNDRVIGTIEVQAYENGAFHNEHVIALDMVANLAAVAIENMRLIEVEAQARDAAEAANLAKDDFLSVLSHELRTPLNAMLGWVRMLRSGVLDAEHSTKALEVIERNTRQQGSLIEDLLDVSRIISGRMRVDTELVDLVAIVNVAVETVRPLAVNKDIELNTVLDPEGLFVDGDTVRLQQVITNLLQNAVKFTPANGKIMLSAGKAADSAVITVQDTGVGIEPEFLPNIFDRFSQADASSSRNYTGLGLGLTIVSTIVELHGGEINAASEGKDMGATFTVRLPLQREFYKSEASEASAPDETAENLIQLEGTSILLVDDDAESLLPLQIFLERTKANVVCAGSVSEALTKLAVEDFHLLISDIAMPLRDGYQLIEILRTTNNGRNSQIPAIALTAYASEEDRRRALDAGFQTHIVKPVELDQLLETMVMYLER